MLFEKEYAFQGKHAEMVRRLMMKESDGIGRAFFETNYQIYAIAPLIGWIYQQRAQRDKGGNSTKVFGDKISIHKDELLFNYHTILALYYHSQGIEGENLTECVFGGDDKEEENYEIYNSYVLGGVEILYNKIFEEKDAVDIDGYLMNIYDLVEELAVRMGKMKPELE